MPNFSSSSSLSKSASFKPSKDWHIFTLYTRHIFQPYIGRSYRLNAIETLHLLKFPTEFFGNMLLKSLKILTPLRTYGKFHAITGS